MGFHYIPALEIFMAILGFGFTIMFCTAFCRACHRFREEQLERQRERPPSVYFIPFPRSVSLPQGEDPPHRPPPYSTAMFAAPPPAYNELGLKPDELPPAYAEYVGVTIGPVMTPPQADMVQSRGVTTPPQADMVQPRVMTPPQADMVQPRGVTTPPQADMVQPRVMTPPQADMVQPRVMTPPQADMVQPRGVMTPPQADMVQPRAHSHS